MAAVLAALALSSIGCAAEPDDAASAESNATSTNWKITSLGQSPGHDIGSNERVAIAIDGNGTRHAVYLSGKDEKTHYVNLTTKQDVALDASSTSDAMIALDPRGEPHLAFYSDKGLQHASRKNGQWVVEAVGVSGFANAIAIDSKGTVHIASDYPEGDGKWSAHVSTLAAGATAFVHAEIPGRVDGEIGFGVNALAVDANGGEYMMLSSFKSTPDGSGAEHAYYVRRPAGGQFVVEMLDASLQNNGSSITVDKNGTVHAVLAAPGSDGTAPTYIRRGANDSSWSAAEKISWDGYGSSVQVDASGTVHVAFTGNRSSYAKYATRTATGWTEETITTADAKLPTLALDASGRPLISFRAGDYQLAERP